MTVSANQNLPGATHHAAEDGHITNLADEARPPDPFVDGSGKGFYYRSEALHQRIELINHLIEFGRQIIVVTGVPGAGKSALLAQIDNAEQSTSNVLRFSAGTTLDRPSLHNTIAAALNVETDPKAIDDALGPIRTHLRRAADNGQRCVAIIDDANTLASECLQCLIKLANTDDESEELRVVLALDVTRSTQLTELQNLAPAENLIHVVEIPPASERVTCEMLRHRWQNAYDGDLIPLSTLEMAQIYRQSNGVAGKAILLARQVQMLGHDGLARGRVNRYRIAGVAALGLIIAAVLAVYKAPDTAPTEIELVRPAERLAAPAHPEPHEPHEPPYTVTQVITAVPTALTGSGQDSDAGASSALTANNAIARQPPNQPVANADKVSASTVSPATAPASAEPSQPYSLGWLQRQGKSGYVLQLFGVRDRAAATSFIQDNALAGQSTIFVTEHAKAPWFAVLYGHYATRSKAQAAIGDLPAKLQATKPWARPLISLE